MELSLELFAARPRVLGLLHREHRLARVVVHLSRPLCGCLCGAPRLVCCVRGSAIRGAPGAHRECVVPRRAGRCPRRHLRGPRAQLILNSLLPAAAAQPRLGPRGRRTHSEAVGVLVGLAGFPGHPRRRQWPVQGIRLHAFRAVLADGTPRLYRLVSRDCEHEPEEQRPTLACSTLAHWHRGCSNLVGVRVEIPAHRGHVFEHVSAGQPHQFRSEPDGTHPVICILAWRVHEIVGVATISVLRLLYGCDPSSAHDARRAVVVAARGLRRDFRRCRLGLLHAAAVPPRGAVVVGLIGGDLLPREQYLVPCRHGDRRAFALWSIRGILSRSACVDPPRRRRALGQHGQGRTSHR
mmetsp:Transcript_68221/g.197623  ORF Transcript_68221/g.197623 Transcript_68221/m.197623 type:complete len:352 (+) Transcript_68221:267-1322(+)